MAVKASRTVHPQTTFEFSTSFKATVTKRKITKSAIRTRKSLLKVKMFSRSKTKTKTWRRLSRSLMILKMTLRKKFMEV